MRLIGLHIENFGGLQNFSLEFDSGITIINEPNGFGKTTLATFIRTMFYGFDSKDRGLRKKYNPWQSGTYGGNITFEHKGEKYRVERTFGATPKGDSFTLYKLDPMRKCEDFSENLGQELFELDAASFERSTYMPQIRDNSSFSTANIQAKLGNLVEDTNDINNYDKAVELLKKARSGLKHYRGDSGSISDAQRKIAELELKSRDLKQQKILLQQMIVDSQKLKKEVDEHELHVKKIREELSLGYSVAVRKELQKQHIKLLEEKKELAQQIEIYRNKCSEIPNDEQIKSCRERLEKLATDKINLANVQQQLQETVLRDKIPTEQQLEENREKLLKIDALRREISRSTAVEQPKKTNKTAALLVLFGIILVAVAIVLFVTNRYAIGAAVVALGAVSLIGAVYFGIKNMVSSHLSSTNLATKETEERIQSLENEVRTFVTEYGAEGENLFDAISSLKKELENSQKTEKNTLIKRELEQEISLNKANIVAFISRYVEITEDDNLTEKLTQVQLKAHQETATYKELLNRMATNEKQLTEFVEQNGETLKLPVTEETIDVEGLKQTEATLVAVLNEKNTTLSNIKSRITTLQEEADALPEIEDEIQRLDKTRKEDISKMELLDKTVELLSTAKDSLSMSYLGDIKKHFVHYMHQLSEETDDTMFLNQNLEVTLERNGVARELTSFSAGYTDIVLLCMRFALVDALFPETKPFIILDDPFVNLDDANTKKAIDLLKKLGEDRQIIYLVCNSSRSV